MVKYLIYERKGLIKLLRAKGIEDYSAITQEISELADLCVKNSSIDPQWYTEYKVFRGLRDLKGNGVLTGLTEISEIQASEMINGEKVSRPGELYYRGIAIESLVDGFSKEDRFGFEETAYLLMFGSLPTEQQLGDFKALLAKYRSLPTSFVRDIIMKAPSFDMMNALARSVLTMYSYDYKANDTSVPNVIRQCLQLIALFPMLSVYGYQAYDHYFNEKSLIIHTPQPELSTAENILYMLRSDSKYTELEAKILDLALVLHAEHGGGNNSTFTTHVVGSSGTDTYSVIAAALGSLKGPKHGGANIKVVQMFNDLKQEVTDWNDEDMIRAYLRGILNR
ncbi:MAG: citrate synthase, partial [Clostridia bacterium]|nr:citrate synthase [Clostridia bacterium]